MAYQRWAHRRLWTHTVDKHSHYIDFTAAGVICVSEASSVAFTGRLPSQTMNLSAAASALLLHSVGTQEAALDMGPYQTTDVLAPVLRRYM